MSYKNLFSPAKIGMLTLKNRVIMGPTETLYASAFGEVTEPIIDYYEQRARGGVGMIVLHSVQGNTDVDPFDPYAGSLRLDNDVYIPMMSQLTERVHQYGAKIAALVSVGGGARANGDRYIGKPGEDVLVGPSNAASGAQGRPVRMLTVDEIQTMIEAYGKCAQRARIAGFDAFYIHALGAYLLAEFLSPVFNSRTDEYGGSFENRSRLLFELVDSCQRHAGKDFPLIARFSVDELCKQGRTVEESIELAKRLEAAGVAALDLSVGFGERKSIRMPSIYVRPRTAESYIRKVRESVSLPVVYQGRLNNPSIAEKVLKDGLADFILISRGIIAEPEWVNKVKENRLDEMRNCLCCNYCLAKRIVNKLPLRCAFNPMAGRETVYRDGLVRTNNPKHIAVFGAGPAGLEATRVLAERGHTVDLYEATEKICGGQLRAAQQPPAKEILQNIPTYYTAALAKNKNVTIHLCSTVDESAALAIDADEYIIATGAKDWKPNVLGIDTSDAVAAIDVLLKKVDIGSNVVIAGGGQVGAETAHLLAERGKKVRIVEMQDYICALEEPNTRDALLAELEELHVEFLTGKRIVSMEKGKVCIEDVSNHSTATLVCDSIVLAFGMQSENTLYDSLLKNGKSVHLIGDAAKVSNIAHAIEQGFLLGNQIG